MQKTNTPLQRLILSMGLLICLFLGTTSVQAQCDADFGSLSAPAVCIKSDTVATIQTAKASGTVVPAGYQTLYVLTSGDGLVIENVGQFPFFEVNPTGSYTIHTLVYDPTTLDLGIVQIGVTTGVDVNGLLVQGGGDICAALDVAGAKFSFDACEDPCFAGAGTLSPADACLEDGSATLVANQMMAPDVPAGYQVIYVLTSGEDLVIQNVNVTPEFTVDTTGRFTIHTLVFDPATLDLNVVDIGVTTGVDVNGLLQQGGGDICAALDVAGAAFDVEECVCEATAGSLAADTTACFDEDAGMATLTATVVDTANVPDGFTSIYVLTSGDDLVIQNVSATPEFMVDTTGIFTIHTLVYDTATLDLGIVQIGVTTGVDVNGLLEQGGGDICAALDVAGARFEIEACACDVDAGTLIADEGACFNEGDTVVTISATIGEQPMMPEGYLVIYVLTSGDSLLIIDANTTPEFDVTAMGDYTIHTLAYNPTTLDLGIVEFGVTTGFDVNGLLEQGGGDICAALDVAGAAFSVGECPCEASAGTLTANDADCLSEASGSTTISASEDAAPNVPEGYQTLYVLTSGDGLVIQNVSAEPSFDVTMEGTYTIHTLVYDTATLDLGIVELGVTTGFDVNALLVQGGGDICASLDVAGAAFTVEACPCEASAGTLTGGEADCLSDGGMTTLTATEDAAPTVPAGYQVLYVLTSGDGLVIENVSATPSFDVSMEGTFTIHTLVYDTATLDLGIVELGVTTGFDVNALLVQGGGDICAALDVAGAQFTVEACPCEATAGTLSVDAQTCADLSTGEATISATQDMAPNVPDGYQTIYVLTSGEGLVIENVSATPDFTVTGAGLYTIHTLVYDTATLDLGIVELGVTTGVDVNGLLVQGGGDICAALDVAGAQFTVEDCPCEATAGTLLVESQDCIKDGGTGMVNAIIETAPNIPAGYASIYVLTSGDGLVIENVSSTPSFEVSATGKYTIHTLVYDPTTLDLGIVEFGVTTGFDVNGLITQGGGDICAALDVAGASFEVEACGCEADAGTLFGAQPSCFTGQYPAALSATHVDRPNRPTGFRTLYVLTSGDGLVIENVSSNPYFLVGEVGDYTIHTLVYNPNTLDLGIVQFGVTTGFDVNSLLVQGGGTICGSLDVAGAKYSVKECAGRDASGGATRSSLIYPNPGSDVVNLALNKATFAGKVEVTVFDMFGASAKKFEIEAATTNTELNVSDLPSGMYMVKILYADKTEEVLRFNKQQ